VSAQLLDGKAVADKVKQSLASRVAELQARTGRRPGLAVVLVGHHPASEVYVRNKGREAEKAGMLSETRRLDADSTTEKLLAEIAELNRRDDIHGILVQLPLPAAIDKERVIETIAPAKDVDGFHPVNVGNLVLNRPGFVPCTPAGVMALLAHYKVELAGSEAVVVGRSDIVGKPMALLLLRQHATVTICHSRSRDLETITRRADVLIAAIGRPAFITDEHVKPGAAVVDVGINPVATAGEALDYFAGMPERLAEFERKGSALVGDVHPSRVRAVAGFLSPVPGGVGPLTIAFLLRNALTAFERTLA